jgi:hypothetical protein
MLNLVMLQRLGRGFQPQFTSKYKLLRCGEAAALILLALANPHRLQLLGRRGDHVKASPVTVIHQKIFLE